MNRPRNTISSHQRGAALLIVLAFVVLLTGLGVAYLSRTTNDRQVAHGSYNQTKADQLVASAMDNIIGDLRKEIANGSTATTEPDGTTLYTASVAANMIPRRSGSAAIAPNLIRRSVRDDSIIAPGLPSKASEVNSTTDASANGRSVTLARWNTHYMLPKYNIGNDDTYPPSPLLPPFNPYPAVPSGFTPPDWVFITSDPTNTDAGRRIISTPDPLVIGRYSYAIYDVGGLLDMNVAGYPTDPAAAPIPVQRVGRKGSIAYADLTALGNEPIPNPNTTGAAVYQVDRLVGWRNYATTRASNNFPDVTPASQAFARNFQTSTAPATNFYNYIVNNPTGFLSPCAWDSSLLLCSTAANWNGRTDQSFVQRQELVAFRNTSSSGLSANQKFPSNALQYLSTFSRETNGPSFSPATPTATNPNFLTIRAATAFTRFDGTIATLGEPLVKTRFPLSRLAWITYKGPSASLATTDPVYQALINAGVNATTIKAGTAANIKTCFGLVWDSRAYVPATATTNAQGQQWVYVSPNSTNTGGNFDPSSNPSGNAASDIKTLATVASENREPDFFELLRAGILDASLGQNTRGLNGVPGVTSSAADAQGANTFPDLHMSNKALHVLSIGTCIIDQADPDSIPIRVQFQPIGASVWWTAYGVESLPYISQIYPITGTSPAINTNWATYLLFQLWNPHVGGALPTPAPQVRLRVEGNIGIFTGGNGQTWSTAADSRTFALPASGVSIALTTGAFPQTLPTPTPAPLSTPPVAAIAPPVGSATAPAGFEILPPKLTNSASSIQQYIGLRLLPDYRLTSRASGNVPQLVLYFGTDPTHEFNATMEYTSDGANWVPYNHFSGIIDHAPSPTPAPTVTPTPVPGSWINGATVPVHNSGSLSGTPNPSTSGTNNDQFSAARLTDFPIPDSLIKSDPRATRFGILQFKQIVSSSTARITDPLWPAGNTNYPNGWGGSIADPNGPVEHAPLRFSTSGGGNGIYFPATLCVNNAASTSTRTSYADGDAVIRPADATYPDPTVATTGSSTPYYSASTDYHPIMLNRPFRNVAELGYAFRDLPWKTLDFFTDKSADAGLLDIFTINDGPVQLDGNNNFVRLGPVPTIVAGQVNLNSTQTPDLQSIFAGAILDEINSTTVNKTGTGATDAPVLAANVVNATSTPMRNRSELITRSGLPTSILPVALSGATHDQTVKSRREVVARAISSVSQTRVWNLLIDVVAQSGHYKPNAANLQNDFIVEGEQHYWVHVAIDRFTGQVIDKQIEVVNE